MRFIKATFPSDKADAVIKVIEAAKPIDWSLDSGYGRFEKAAEILVAKGSGQKLPKKKRRSKKIKQDVRK